MSSKAIFVGRNEETKTFARWIVSDCETTGEKRAALIVGSAGMGKSALINEFERLCLAHGPERWYVQAAVLNDNEGPSGFLGRLLRNTHRLFTGKYLREGPRDKRLFVELLKAIPAFGKLIAALVEEKEGPGWERFEQYVAAVSEALAKGDDRLVLLIAPDKYMQSGQASEWLTIAGRLPPNIRLVIAQRPDDVLAGHDEAATRFRFLTAGEHLGQLGEPEIDEWYAAELAGGRLTETARQWSAEDRRTLPGAAFERYQGYPVAHDAVMRLLAVEQVRAPIEAIRRWPRELQDLMDALFKSLARQGEDRLRAAKVLRIFGIPTPPSTWAAAADVSAEWLTGAHCDARYKHFFDDKEDGWQPFHALFAERIDADLAQDRQRTNELARACWKAIESELDPEKLRTSIPGEFELLAATNIAAHFTDRSEFLKTVNLVTGVKLRLGLLDALASDALRAKSLYPDDEGVDAAFFGNMGLIYEARGDLDQAERMLRKALEINEKLGRLEGMAIQYGNLGVIYKKRGDLNQAERMHRKSLKINEKLGRLEGMACDYGNLGTIYQTRGDLGRAEEMLRKSLEIEKKLGRLEGMAIQYGNLGVIYRTRGDLEQAERMLLKALEINEKIGRLEGMASNYGNLGTIYGGRRDLDQAEQMFRKSLEIDEKLGRLEGIANQYGNLGTIYKKRGDVEQARTHWLKARDMFEQVGIPGKVNDVQELLDSLPESKSAD